MLTRRWIACAAAVLAGSVLPSAVSPASTAAQPFTDCPNDAPPYIDVARCDFGVNDPQIGDGPFALEVPPWAPGGGCTRPNGVDNDSSPAELDANGPREVACEWTGVAPEPHYRGRYSSTWDCYLVFQDGEEPNDTMIGYRDDLAEEGLVYAASCFPPPAAIVREAENPRGLGHWRTGPFGADPSPDLAQWAGPGQLVVLEAPPPFDEEGPGLIEVWVDAINQLEMYGPAITAAPPIDTAGLVHLPVWLWTEEVDRTWPDQLQAEASGGGWTVEAYAEPRAIEWDMGDGEDPVRCERPGIAWDTGMDFLNPPDEACTYTYQRSSLNEPGGAFEITAVTTWFVSWEIDGGYDGDVEIQVGTTASYQVDEVQVLTTR